MGTLDLTVLDLDFPAGDTHQMWPPALELVEIRERRGRDAESS